MTCYWWPEAQALAEQGYSLQEIAKRVDRHRTNIIRALDPEFREQQNARARERNRGRKTRRKDRQRQTVLEYAREQAQTSGRSVDEMLVDMGAPPRWGKPTNGGIR